MARKPKPTQKQVDYRATFATESGHRVLRDILRSCFFWQGTLQTIDPTIAIFNEGRRNAALDILANMGLNDSEMDALMAASEDQYSDDLE